ncbi:MAG: TatD family hydrolase [Neisseriaceae bacterium]|nr:TatD family hydrolase [Neisseriaceae bacterium]
MSLQRLSALINCFAIYWIATIFSTKKSRNDTRFLILSRYHLTMIDTHCHLTEFPPFVLPEILANAEQCGVRRLISVSASFDDWQKNQEIAKRYPQVIPAFGIHPLFQKNLPNDWLDILCTCLKALPQAIVGEIGLDFYHSPNACEKQQQIDLFLQQLAIVQAFSRPVAIHCVKAHNECIALIKKQKFNCGGFVHGFSGSLQQANDWIKLGFKIGIGVVLLKQNSRLRTVLPQLPDNAWVMESDSPFMLPENTPAIISQIAQIAAQLSKKSITQMTQQTTQNAIRCILLKY